MDEQRPQPTGEDSNQIIEERRAKLRGGLLVDMDADALVANARQWRSRIARIEVAP